MLQLVWAPTAVGRHPNWYFNYYSLEPVRPFTSTMAGPPGSHLKSKKIRLKFAVASLPQELCVRDSDLASRPQPRVIVTAHVNILPLARCGYSPKHLSSPRKTEAKVVDFVCGRKTMHLSHRNNNAKKNDSVCGRLFIPSERGLRAQILKKTFGLYFSRDFSFWFWD
jgi:hypothetical protein